MNLFLAPGEKQLTFRSFVCVCAKPREQRLYARGFSSLCRPQGPNIDEPRSISLTFPARMALQKRTQVNLQASRPHGRTETANSNFPQQGIFVRP